MPCTRVPEGPRGDTGARVQGYRYVAICSEDIAAVYYDYTAASVVPNYGDFLYREIFSSWGYVAGVYRVRCS